jgi:hypothetical protein
MDVVLAGRRWGKTHSGVQRITFNALADPGLYWWVGLGWRSASLKRAWRELKNISAILWDAYGEKKPERHVRESTKELTLPGGSEVWMRTAERPDSLAGEGIKGCVLDEFTLMREEVWTEYVEATLLDHNGWGLFIGVPKGNNWGGRLWKRAVDRPGWNQWHFPTSSNPSISADRLESIRLHTPSKLFDQEYLAKLVEGAGLVFSGIHECISADPISEPNEGCNYVFGLDWGKNNDWTVISVVEADTKNIAYIERFNDISYPLQLDRVRRLNSIFQPRCIVAEVNAMGEPLCDQLIQDGLPIEKFWTTNKSKRQVIEGLVVGIEQKEIGLINHKELLNELEVYESKVTGHGNVTYNAPEGEHDDCVMSLALAWEQVRHDIGITF